MTIEMNNNIKDIIVEKMLKMFIKKSMDFKISNKNLF